MKTKQDNYDALCEKISALHSYEVPELLLLPIEQGLPAYMRWLAEQLP